MMKEIRFLADVNIEKSIVDLLKKEGFDILWIPDYNCQLTDDELLDLSNKEGRILITNGKDFGELMFLQKKISCGIILIRIKGQDVEKKKKEILKLLELYKEKIINHFIVITDTKIRFIDIGDIK